MKKTVPLLTILFLGLPLLLSGEELGKRYEEMDRLGRELYDAGDFYASDSVYTELTAMKRESEEDSRKYALAVNELIRSRIALDRYEGLEELIDGVVPLLEYLFGYYSLPSAEAFNSRGIVLMNRGEYEEAETWLETAAELRKSDELLYGRTLFLLGMLHYYRKNYPEAEEYYGRALDLFLKNLDRVKNEYYTTMSSLSVLYAHMGMFEVAMTYLQEAISDILQKHGEGHPDYIAMMANLGAYHFSLGHFPEAEKAYLQATERAKEYFGEHNDYYLHALGGLSLYYQYTGQYATAESLMRRSLRLRIEKNGRMHGSVAVAMNNLAVLYKDTGNLEASRRMQEEALMITAAVAGKDHDYALYLNNLATLYMDEKDVEQAVEVLSEAMDILNESDVPHLTLRLNILRNFFAIMIRYEGFSEEEAIGLAEEMVRMTADLYGKANIHYATAVLNHGEGLSMYGRYGEAVERYKQALALYEDAHAYGPLYLFALYKLALNLEKDGRLEAAADYLEDYLAVLKQQTHENFLFLPEKERQRYIESQTGFLAAVAGLAARNVEIYPRLATLAYDCQLFSRSILLNSSAAVRRKAMEASNPATREKWESLAAGREAVESSRNLLAAFLSEGGTGLSVDEFLSLLSGRPDAPDLPEPAVALGRTVLDRTAACRILEREILEAVQDRQAEPADFHLGWKDIRTLLDPGETVVELFTLDRGAATGTPEPGRMYALVMNAADSLPTLIPLGSEKDLPAAFAAGTGDDRSLYELLWRPLEAKLAGTETLYLAVSGAQSRIPPRMIRDEIGSLAEKYDLRYLLSSKDLRKLKNSPPLPGTLTAVLFGGADYDLPYDRLTPTTREVCPETDDLFDPVQAETIRRISDATRGQGFGYLPGSREEVLAAARILETAGVKTYTFLDDSAGETHFKACTRLKPDILHLSTHGFYYPPETPDRPAGQELPFHPNVHSENPLVRSGLLFSGANNAWTGSRDNTDPDDGILTSLEIAHTDLSSVRLAFLPACHTALGDIDDFEGTYGIQRALRLAGAGAMIISLWTVPDREAVEFTEFFYARFIGDRDLKKSFDHAMEQMREKYPGEPAKWAGYLLIE